MPTLPNGCFGKHNCRKCYPECSLRLSLILPGMLRVVFLLSWIFFQGYVYPKRRDEGVGL